VRRIGSSLAASGKTRPLAPATWLTWVLGARAPRQTDAMLEEPQNSVMSDSTRIEKGSRRWPGTAGSRARS